MHLTSRRLLAGGIGLMALTTTGLACTGHPTPSPGTRTTTTSTTGGTVPGEDCGTLAYASGWPTTTATRRGWADCILGHWTAGTPARMTTRDQTDGNGGHASDR